MSFLALKTHLDPMTFAPGGASSSSQVPAASNVTSSSSIAFSHSGQSGLRLACAAPRPRNQQCQQQKHAQGPGSPRATQVCRPQRTMLHVPPASSGSSANEPGSCMPTPSLHCKSRTRGEGLRVCVEQCNCGSSLGIDVGALAGAGVGVIAGSGGTSWMGSVEGVEGVCRASDCFPSNVSIIVSSPLN